MVTQLINSTVRIQTWIYVISKSMVLNTALYCPPLGLLGALGFWGTLALTEVLSMEGSKVRTTPHVLGEQGTMDKALFPSSSAQQVCFFSFSRVP